jgi:ParB family chromosome partitioning protein
MKVDLSGLDQFKASSLVADRVGPPAGAPLEVALDAIDFDPKQPRRTVNEASLAELAASIQGQGVLEPVSLRTHPDQPGRYLLNRGERRVRASRIAGLRTVPAFLDERVDPFAQAIENLQREDLSPFDLARFIAEREQEGHSRAQIARKLSKSASFITEAAGLIDAPAEVRALFDAGRVRDTRVLYQLARSLRENRQAIEIVLAGDGPITRDTLEGTLAALPPAPPFRMRNERGSPLGTGDASENKTVGQGDERSAPAATQRGKKLGLALVVEHAGRRGRLGWAVQPGERTGEVLFDDGACHVVALAELRLIAWTAR